MNSYDGQKFYLHKLEGQWRACDCEKLDDCPHEKPIIQDDRCINGMKAGVRYTDELGNDV